MNNKHIRLLILAGTAWGATSCSQTENTALPSSREVYRSFGEHDEQAFVSPPKVYHPETWFHFIGGNISKEGITADLEAIAEAGISGIQLFHGQFGGAWPGMENRQISCLSPEWDEAVKHTAEECRRLGLRFTMQNCPGWAMSGGPWIKPSQSMRHLVHSRTDIEGGEAVAVELPQPQPSGEEWRDYKDVAVIAFPTPEGDNGTFLVPQTVTSNDTFRWRDFMCDKIREGLPFEPASDEQPHRVDVTFAEAVTVRSIMMASVTSMNLAWCYKPEVSFKVEAILPNGTASEVLNTTLPWGSWQDDPSLTLACSEAEPTRNYRVTFSNKHDIRLFAMRMYSAARKNDWEAAAGFTLRGFMRRAEHPQQSPAAFVKPDKVIDISDKMHANGQLRCILPKGRWTVLRIGHVNTGYRNAPAPPEATGWECNKLSEEGPNAHFAGYIGRLAEGPLAGGLLNGMLLDSWECGTQTWTANMESEFTAAAGYPLRQWFPAIFGYVVGDHETTTRFLLDWQNTIGNLFADKFFGQMSRLAKEKNMSIAFETAAGDVFPADIMKYYKYADVPMCEFWQPVSDSYVGNINFKPIKPTVSAARLYGKRRVAAEAFTSFNLTWNEHFSMFKEIGNIKNIEGVTHFVFHTYTHNPRTDFLPPSTSFGSNIGSPFLRLQTWWKQMPELVGYFSRCNYMLERGRPVSDVLWYLGDEITNKPDQEAAFPAGYKYDYCNPDVLLNRLSVDDGMIVTPEGLRYRLLWLNDNRRMRPETLEKILELVKDGATVVGNAPEGRASLSDKENAEQRFEAAVKSLWGDGDKVGEGRVMSGMSLEAALNELKIQTDVNTTFALWLHRQTKNADWYFVCTPQGKSFHGNLSFRCRGKVEIWDPVTGEITPAVAQVKGDRTEILLAIPQAGSYFVVFRHDKHDDEPATFKSLYSDPLSVASLQRPWTVSFPPDWDMPALIRIPHLMPWKDFDVSEAGKAFAGTACYTTTFAAEAPKAAPLQDKEIHYFLDLGDVEMIATVSVNGKKLRTLWAPLYRLDITEAVKEGENTLSVEVTSTWFNRLVFDASLPENERKTWTIGAPPKDAPLKNSGLLGPVKLIVVSKN